jgi:hypothetical protein
MKRKNIDKINFLGNEYTFAYNVSTISAIFICPINGYLLGFKADQSRVFKRNNIFQFHI